MEITIKNLGPIKNIELCLDKPGVVVIGPQASGKSTLAKCIYVAKLSRIVLSNTILSAFNSASSMDEDVIYNNFIAEIRKIFIQTLGINEFNFNKESYVKYKCINDIILQIYWVNGGVELTYSDNVKQKLSDVIKEVQRISANVLDDGTKGDVILKYCYQEMGVFFGEPEVIYIPAGRSLISSLLSDFGALQNMSTDFCVRQFIQRIMVFKSWYTKTMPSISSEAYKGIGLDIENILKGCYTTEKGIDFIKVDNKLVPVTNASSGQQEALWILNLLLKLIYENRKAQIIIEEPEAHLFPDAQFDLIKAIVHAVKATDSSILITTHSPYILNTVNVLLYSGMVERDESDGIIDLIYRIPVNCLDGKYIHDGICETIMNEDGLIAAEVIDRISSTVNNLFDLIMSKEVERIE